MNIMHLAPEIKAGSLTQLPVDLACGLQEQGLSNIILCPPNELISQLNTAGVEQISFSRKSFCLSWVGSFNKLRHLITQHKPHVLQLYHIKDLGLVNFTLKLLPAKNRPHVVMVHTDFEVLNTPKSRLKGIKAATTISKHLRQEIVDHVGEHCPLWIIPYGTDEHLCTPHYESAPAWKQQWKRGSLPQHEGDELFTLCVPGNITPVHGLEDLVPILSILRAKGIPAQAMLTGDIKTASPQYVQELRKLFRNSGVSDYITWLGPRSDMRDVLSNCMATLSLCRKPATYNRAAQEALSLGRPVVGYDHGTIGELLRSFLPEGCVKAGNAERIADTLTQWHTYPPELPKQIPYPYRLSDTIQNYKDLYATLS